jgi:flagellar basal-body rod protein FlgG
MVTIQERTNVTSNNLANVDTAGFKQDLLQFVSAPEIHTWRIDDPTSKTKDGRNLPEYIGLTNCGTADTKMWRDFSQGQVLHTGNPLDVAIVGDGFFRVTGGDGAEYYTRDGQFRRSADGFLVDNQGRRVQGLEGDILLGDGAELYVNRGGEVYVDGAVAGVIDLAYFTDPQAQLSKAGDNAWVSDIPPDGVGASEFRGGYIERSNVDPIRGITELIRELRHFQAAEKAVVSGDETLNVAANQIGKLPQ